MTDIEFVCPHCGQNLNGPEDLAGQTIDCPVCQKSFEIPGGIIEVPKEKMVPPPPPPAPRCWPAAATRSTRRWPRCSR